MTGRIDRRRFIFLAPAAVLALGAGAATRVAIPLATDLRADGRASRSRKAPIVILFSLPGCPYCEIVRRSHLAPMAADQRQAGRVLIRQIDIDSDLAIVGFSGERITHEQVARAHGVRSAPVVAFWDGDGREIADPLRGMLLPDFYSAYLESSLEAARGRLALPG